MATVILYSSEAALWQPLRKFMKNTQTCIALGTCYTPLQSKQDSYSVGCLPWRSITEKG